MTYTFKLARRLAVSRHFSMLPALLLFVACSGEDTTSPGSPPDPTSAVAVRITPRKVILATDQPIRFLARGLTSAGDSVGATVAWRTTGGTILPDGRFSAGAVGTFRVMGTNRTGDEVQVDTAIVIVVRRQPHLTKVEVRPGSVSLTPGDSLNFTAIGRTILDRVVPIGVKWTATGGTIDAGGTYVAGDSLGSYQVVAVNMGGTVTDTATVVIDPAPVAPLPPDTLPADTLPPAPEQPPQPVLGEITLIPSTVTLAPATTRQFKAYGRTTDGDSVAVSVVFAATGGTVTQGGLFTAGSSAGTFRLIASDGLLADTSVVFVSAPLGSGPGAGVPFGPMGSLAWVDQGNVHGFTLGMSSVTPANIITTIANARAKHVRLVLAMTGGHHALHMSLIRDTLRFDRTKWDRTMDGFNTPVIKAAVDAGVADGTIIGNSVMDEPHVKGLGDGNTWGPEGTMTKARVDSLCGYVKNIFPTLAVGVVHPWHAFEPTRSYKTCEFIASQYTSRIGSVATWRDEALAMGRRDGIAMLFSMNIINGGTQDRSGAWACPGSARGTYAPNCWMTPDQVRNVATTLGPAGCGLLMWRYDAAFMANAENREAFKAVADLLATIPAKSCSQPVGH